MPSGHPTALAQQPDGARRTLGQNRRDELTEAKRPVPHGQWQEWLRQHLPSRVRRL